MADAYKTVYEGIQGEITEKKSRFIASLKHVETQEEAEAFIEMTRKKYWDARHNCYAYILGKKQEIKRYSDDGEPSMTAGKPILDVLSGSGLCDSIIVVTRYFGGTLLGTGGLVRAYTQASREGVKNSIIIEKKPADLFTVTVDYSQVGKLLYIIGNKGYPQLESNYADNVCIKILVPCEESKAMESQLIESFQGSAGIEKDFFGYYAESEKGLLLFENE